MIDLPTNTQDEIHVFVVHYNWQYEAACPSQLRAFSSKEEADKFIESIDDSMDNPDITEVVVDGEGVWL